jgi:putative polymerase
VTCYDAHKQVVSQSAVAADRSIWLHSILILVALSFNFVLCFIDTNVSGVSPSVVAATEIGIISMVFIASFRSIGRTYLVLVCATFLYLLVLMLVRALQFGGNELDPKIFRDLLIPFAFVLLGMRVSNLRNADTIVLTAGVLVTTVAIFEYLFIDVYLRYFNIIMYYVARGSVAAERLEILSTNLFESGIRPEGRALFPILGDHRVSSIFLEPVSPGNFAVVIFFWATVRLKARKVLCFALFLLALFMVVLADNRFGAVLCLSVVGLALFPGRVLHLFVAYLPFFAMCALLGIAYMFEGFMIDNSFLGRLVLSGEILLAFDVRTWLGIGESARSAFDSGYGYVISQAGIFGFFMLWMIFMMLEGRRREFCVFRSLTGFYFAAVLCVSYSPFTIKTAALVWFLLGALAVGPQTESENKAYKRERWPRNTRCA